MITGIGHDIASLARIGRMLESGIGERFMQRILTGAERELAAACSGARLAEFVGGRFAAKEAVSKALGCGIGGRLGFADIDIGRDPLGKPQCRLSAQAWARLGLSEAHTAIHLSITHEASLASAFAVIERV
ncbi:holo-ACP synthase [Paenibacillus humicola]|uniref:holo-ACP synthase n=1 Tax=Paenibacillus humicola TaxID=3110540 RepID=UPI00237AA856|nr:holo-ACP synthase [Paenibacillus humicola]